MHAWKIGYQCSTRRLFLRTWILIQLIWNTYIRYLPFQSRDNLILKLNKSRQKIIIIKSIPNHYKIKYLSKYFVGHLMFDPFFHFLRKISYKRSRQKLKTAHPFCLFSQIHVCIHCITLTTCYFLLCCELRLATKLFYWIIKCWTKGS